MIQKRLFVLVSVLMVIFRVVVGRSTCKGVCFLVARSCGMA